MLDSFTSALEREVQVALRIGLIRITRRQEPKLQPPEIRTSRRYQGKRDRDLRIFFRESARFIKMRLRAIQIAFI